MNGKPIKLHGCSPTPLASYLKALGVLRLISSPVNHVSSKAADPYARGWWENECFHLRTVLSLDNLLHFFLHKYAPSPIIAPWNGRAGFLEGDAGETSSRGGAVLMRKIEKSECPRLELMRRTVRSLRSNEHLGKYNRLRARVKQLKKESRILSGEDKKNNNVEKSRIEKEASTIKSLLLPDLRSKTTSQHVCYIDTCYVLSGDELPAPLLGSGGNDGSRDFGVNFVENLDQLVDFCNGHPRIDAGTDLESALLNVVWRTKEHGSMGQFSPGQGGVNATTGYEGYNPLNAWDVILAIEGTLVFAGALTRRWGAKTGSRAAFPFTFEHTGAGAGSLSSEDPNRPRGEIWIPIWPKPATFSEVTAIFSEGRLTLGERAAQTGLDAARAVARIGAARGIESFERYSIIQPDSKMPHQATPLGRFNMPGRPRKDLIADLDAGEWLSCARRLVGNNKMAPARARQAMRRLEDALFQMTDVNRELEGSQGALMSLGSLVAWLASNPTARKALKPPPVISTAWTRKADDESAEFRVAAALAAIGLPIPGQSHSTDTLPMAAHFAPLNEGTFFHRGNINTRRGWAEDASPTFVWNAGPLVPNLIAVLERRLVEASIRALDDKPLFSATDAHMTDVAAFLSADFDDARCAALLAGLVWVRPTRLNPPRQRPAPVLPLAYAALKPVFTPDASLRAVSALRESAQMPIPPGIVTHLRAGGNSRDGYVIDLAVRLAMGRARASGLPTLFSAMRRGSSKSTTQASRFGAGVLTDRLAAALLIPIGHRTLSTLIERAYPGALPDHNTNSEDKTHAD